MIATKKKIFHPVNEGESIFFRFEEDFIERNVRCIPMIVRFKLDLVGIKLKLAEWSKFDVKEREFLMEMPCATVEEINRYRSLLENLVRVRTGQEPSLLAIEQSPLWADLENIADELKRYAELLRCTICIGDWKLLNNLQRFALIKLCRPGHENKNFPKAMKEFGLMKERHL